MVSGKNQRQKKRIGGIKIERTIRGTVKNWSDVKSGKNPFIILNLHDHSEGYLFFSQRPSLAKLTVTYPSGTTVEFRQEKKGQYWQYVKSTLKSIQKSNTTTEIKIIRQNSGNHASAMLNILQREGHLKEMSPEEIKDIFFEFAKKYTEWVLS